ncbi:Bro-N domain-containing protein [Streptomyces sp. WP-1]|uniref:BRO-N domain-containing protein n=1 Tax=Streptomyces sp. WP-1 TaxID=3041497 RepID=UPI002648B0E5|nr:Bro-N domain-containing protein [Streptomyces sp. WP-1]WKE70829.1 Bro-N domain-containing protein [Streptomyces sp. WP-1]
MYERNEVPSEQPAGRKQDAIDINDFVFAATGARLRRLTTPDGEHWFPAADVAGNLGYANTRQALLWHVAPHCTQSLEDLARGVYPVDALSKIAGHGLKKSMRMVNLRGLIALVNGCTKTECAPFKEWVAEVIEAIQRNGSYSLDPAPVQPAPDGGTAYLLPQQVADAIVRLEERNLRADEALAVAQSERIEETRRTNDLLGRIADSLDLIADRFRPAAVAPPEAMTPQRLLATWRARNLVVTDDVHAVAAYLAPALVRGPVHCRMEDIAERTGLTVARAHDGLRMLIKRGCVRQTGVAAGGTPVYALP